MGGRISISAILLLETIGDAGMDGISLGAPMTIVARGDVSVARGRF